MFTIKIWKNERQNRREQIKIKNFGNFHFSRRMLSFRDNQGEGKKSERWDYGGQARGESLELPL